MVVESLDSTIDTNHLHPYLHGDPCVCSSNGLVIHKVQTHVKNTKKLSEIWVEC